MRKRIIGILLTLVLILAVFTACSKTDSDADTKSSTQQTAISAEMITMTLSDVTDYESNTTPGADAVTINLSEYTGDCEITQAGEYILTGELTNGKIYVNVDGQVHLYLQGITVHSSDGAAIAIFGSKKKVITLVDGYENYLYDNESYTTFYNEDNDEPNGCLFSKQALTINGNGTLTVSATGTYQGTDDEGNAETKNAQGIVCKDSLKILNAPTINVTSKGNGIKAKDSLEIYGGTYHIVSESDGMKCDSEEDYTTKGYIYILDGTFDIDAGDDGIMAYSNIEIYDGTYNITTAGGANDQASSASYTGSYKGIKNTVGTIRLMGGTFTINTLHNGVDSNFAVLVDGADLTVTCSAASREAGEGSNYVHGHGVHADSYFYMVSGTLTVTQSYEGIEAEQIHISGGNVTLQAQDDGFNASSETGDSSSCILDITGGEVYVSAYGDGLDSNGNITMTGGTVVVDGPTDGGNGSIDYGDNKNTMTVDGGTLVCIGSSGMAENPSSDSSQCYAGFTISDAVSAGETISFYNGDTLIFSFATAKARTGGVIQISSDQIETNQSYTCSYGSSSVTFTGGSVVNGGGMGQGQGGGSFDNRGAGGMQGGGTPPGSM